MSIDLLPMNRKDDVAHVVPYSPWWSSLNTASCLIMLAISLSLFLQASPATKQAADDARDAASKVQEATSELQKATSQVETMRKRQMANEGLLLLEQERNKKLAADIGDILRKLKEK